MALRRLALPRRGRGGAAAGRCAGSTVSATPTRVTDLPAGANHHWTKNIIATADGTKLYATVGSNSNIGDNGLAAEQGRAAIWEIDRASGRKRLHATGLRNPNGMAWEPQTKALWTVVNERDELGDDLVPDYLTSVKDGALYGWPWSYWVGRVDKRVQPTNPGMVARAIAPDYGLGSHVAPLGLAFSDERMPANDRSGAFIGQHGARNRDQLSGYNVVFVPLPRVSRRACRWRCSADSWTTRAGPTAGRSASRSRARALCSSPTMSATRCGG